jgi:histidyl-tRNA synthetase
MEAVGESAASLRYDPTLVRGMGYYTGTIFEIEHSQSSSSIGGGGRYDGMVGKWLGKDVPAVGISLGFERIADLVGESAEESSFEVLVYEPEQLASALRLQTALVANGRKIRLEQRPKNLKGLLEEMTLAGATGFAVLGQENANIAGLEFKPLG